MTEKRTAILNMIKENKEILFGRFSATLSHEDKEKKWKEIARHAHSLGVLDASKDWKYCRDVVWQNWRKRTIDKVEKRQKSSSPYVKKRRIDESDMLILDIIGRDSPEGLYVCKTTEPDNRPKIRVINEAQLKEKPQNRIGSDKQELKNDILKMKLEILKREAYLKDLEIFRKEMELGLPVSEFTQKFYTTLNGNDDDEDEILVFEKCY